VTPRRADFHPPYVDCVFTLRGIGTVVTGTLWSGAVAEDDRLRLEPAGREVRIRSVQVHDTPVASAAAGQRVAVNLPGIERREIRRGDALVAAGAFPRSYRLEVALEELADADGAWLTEHHGTSQSPRGSFAWVWSTRSSSRGAGRRGARRVRARRDDRRRRRRSIPHHRAAWT
jgi:selenocysteine-specific elongation factor